jgi:hypothetical protein
MIRRRQRWLATDCFETFPNTRKPRSDTEPPRLRERQRDQIELRETDIDSLIGEDHLARQIWAYVLGLDLSELENRIKARGDRPGHP